MTDEFDPYKPGSGLKSDFDGWIKDGVFASENYGTNIILMCDCDDGDEYAVRYGIGNGWESYDAGETVQHPSGPRQLFSNSTGYSDFMVFAIECGAKDVLYERARAGQGPRFAANYNGLGFHWDLVDRPTRTPKTDEMGQRVKDDRGREIWENTTRQRLLPVAFLGVRDTQGHLPGSGAAAMSTVVSHPTVAGGDPLAGLDVITQAKVRKAAVSSPDYISFVDVMLELSDADDASIMDHDEIKEALANEDWYASLHKGE